MAKDYDRQKIGEAVSALAVSAAPIQKRLEYALNSLLVLQSCGMAEKDREPELASIIERLTADKSDAGIGYGPKTTQGLSDDEASTIAHDIVQLHTRICHGAIYELEDRLRELA